MNKQNKKAEILSAGLAAAAGLTGVAVLSHNAHKEKPVRSEAVAAKAVGYAGKIASIPVTKAEMIAVEKKAERESIGEPHDADIHVDKRTGQPYRVTDPTRPNDVQIMRVIAKRDAEGAYEFRINDRLDKNGNLDPSQISYVNADVSKGAGPTDRDYTTSLFDANVPSHLRDGFEVEGDDTWGAGYANGLSYGEEAVASADAAKTAQKILTADKLAKADGLMDQAIHGAASQVAPRHK